MNTFFLGSELNLNPIKIKNDGNVYNVGVLTNKDLIRLNQKLFELKIYNVSAVSIENEFECKYADERSIGIGGFYDFLEWLYEDNDVIYEKNGIDDIDEENIQNIKFTPYDVSWIYEHL